MNQAYIQQKAISNQPAPSGILQRACTCGQHTSSGGKCAECRKMCLVGNQVGLQSAHLSQNGGGAGGEGVPPIVYEVLRSPSRPLDAATRAFMEPRFGHDFSRVRVHTGERAAELAQAVNALAYTVGREMVFGGGQFMPSTRVGRRLIAHELTHVVQQETSTGASQLVTRPESGQEAGSEREANSQAGHVMDVQGSSFVEINERPGAAILQRQADISQAPDLLCTPVAVPGHSSGVDLLFATASANISPGQRADLVAFAQSWGYAGSQEEVVVDGYASTSGSQAFNWQLSCDRAEAVKAILISIGIPESKILTFAHGESMEFSARSLAPNQRAVVTTRPAPTPPQPTWRPNCWRLPGAPLPINPGIASGSLCRGACGPDCPSSCTPLMNQVLCVPDPSGNWHFNCEYPDVLRCGSHAGCRAHDLCYDGCASDPHSVICRRACDVNCLDDYGFQRCNSWRTGGGPFDRMLLFSNPPVTSEPLPGPCPPR